MLKNKYLFLMLLESGQPRSGCQFGQVLGEDTFPDLQIVSSCLMCCSRVGEGQKERDNDGDRRQRETERKRV